MADDVQEQPTSGSIIGARVASVEEGYNRINLNFDNGRTVQFRVGYDEDSAWLAYDDDFKERIGEARVINYDFDSFTALISFDNGYNFVVSLDCDEESSPEYLDVHSGRIGE